MNRKQPSVERNQLTRLSGLPADARGPISAALGRHDSGYWIRPVAVGRSTDGFRGENPRQAMEMKFTKRGAEVRSHKLDWALETRGYGYGDAVHPLKQVAPEARENRVEYRRGGVTEWYQNGPLGLEQGFTLIHRPGRANGQSLTLELALTGDLMPRPQSTSPNMKSKSLELRRKDGQLALRYTGLSARDATGRELRSWLEVRRKRLLVRVDDAGAQYPVVVDPWIQQAELTASDGATGDGFGISVALSGNTAVVGAFSHQAGPNANQGAAYVFVQNGGTWSQQDELTASDGGANDHFGGSVAISGDTVVVGAFHHNVGSNAGQGAAYVFVKSGEAWIQQAELTSSDGGAGDAFGSSVAISGGTVVVGAYLRTIGSNAGQGATYVFVQSGTTWSQQAELTASDGEASDYFGWSVAVSGGTALVGAYNHKVGSNTNQGAAYIFAQSGSTWNQQVELTASDGGARDYFGWSVAVSESTAAVGAYNHTVGSNTSQGAAYVFGQSGTTWSQQAELTASDGGASDYFGWSVAVSGNTAAVGATQHTIGSNSGQGAAYVFMESGGTWSQKAELTSFDGTAYDRLGYSAGVSGDTAMVGAYYHAVGSNQYQGAAYALAAPTTTVTISPAWLTFGNVAVNTTSNAKTVTLRNTGSATLNITSVAITAGTNFAISSNTCGTTLAVKKTCKVGVTFAPTALGAATGTLSFTDDAPGPQTVALSGTGIAQVMLNPPSISFANQAVFTPSAPKPFTLINNLPASLSISGITFTGADPGDFAETDTCGGSVAAKSKCTILVTFTPQSTGGLSAVLNVSDSANNSPQTSKLIAAGELQVRRTPALMTFAGRPVGTTSIAKYVVLTNDLTTAVSIGSITFTGADPGDFAAQNGSCGSSIAPKSKCFISVTFTPQAIESRTATLNITDSANNSPQTVSVRGWGDIKSSSLQPH